MVSDKRSLGWWVPTASGCLGQDVRAALRLVVLEKVGGTDGFLGCVVQGRGERQHQRCAQSPACERRGLVATEHPFRARGILSVKGSNNTRGRFSNRK